MEATKGLNRERLLRPRNLYRVDISHRPHEKLSSSVPRDDQKKKKEAKVNSSTFGLAHRTMVVNVALTNIKKACLANFSMAQRLKLDLIPVGS